MGESGGVAGIMESPFSPGLSHRLDEDWGEWDPIMHQVGSASHLQVSSSLLPPSCGDRCGPTLPG